MEKRQCFNAALPSFLMVCPPQICRTTSRACLFPSLVSSPFSRSQTRKCYVQTYLLESKPRRILDPLALFFHRWNYTHLSLLFSHTKATFDWFCVSTGPHQGKRRVVGCFPVVLGCWSKVAYNNPTTIILSPPCLRWLLPSEELQSGCQCDKVFLHPC